MNSAKFNEPFARYLPRITAPGVLDSPMFICSSEVDNRQTPDYSEYQKLIPFLADGKILPFPSCRVVIPGVTRLWLHSAPNILSVLFSTYKNPISISGFTTDLKKLKVEETLFGVPLMTNGYIRKAARYIVMSVVRFIIDSMASGNFIAIVTPVPKSENPNHVKWAQSQKHYVIVHRKDRMNSVGAVPSPDGKKTSEIRMAHTRRAHMRILRSARFKENQGRHIFIKSCWVGPVEWKTNGSIYKILP